MNQNLILKLSLVSDLNDITDLMLGFNLKDDDNDDQKIEKLESELAKRQNIIEKINEIDAIIKDKIKNEDEIKIEKQIKEVIKKISDKDKELNSVILEVVLKLKANYYNTKEIIEQGKVELSDEDKKEKGYFLNLKG